MVIQGYGSKSAKSKKIVGDLSYARFYKQSVIVLVGVSISFLHDQPCGVVPVRNLLG